MNLREIWLDLQHCLLYGINKIMIRSLDYIYIPLQARISKTWGQLNDVPLMEVEFSVSRHELDNDHLYSPCQIKCIRHVLAVMDIPPKKSKIMRLYRGARGSTIFVPRRELVAFRQLLESASTYRELIFKLVIHEGFLWTAYRYRLHHRPELHDWYTRHGDLPLR
jgi:hypothetical protein